jgi:hypothetical protein
MGYPLEGHVCLLYQHRQRTGDESWRDLANDGENQPTQRCQQSGEINIARLFSYLRNMLGVEHDWLNLYNKIQG